MQFSGFFQLFSPLCIWYSRCVGACRRQPMALIFLTQQWLPGAKAACFYYQCCFICFMAVLPKLFVARPLLLVSHGCCLAMYFVYPICKPCLGKPVVGRSMACCPLPSPNLSAICSTRLVQIPLSMSVVSPDNDFVTGSVLCDLSY